VRRGLADPGCDTYPKPVKNISRIRILSAPRLRRIARTPRPPHYLPPSPSPHSPPLSFPHTHTCAHTFPHPRQTRDRRPSQILNTQTCGSNHLWASDCKIDTTPPARLARRPHPRGPRTVAPPLSAAVPPVNNQSSTDLRNIGNAHAAHTHTTHAHTHGSNRAITDDPADCTIDHLLLRPIGSHVLGGRRRRRLQPRCYRTNGAKVELKHVVGYRYLRRVIRILDSEMGLVIHSPLTCAVRSDLPPSRRMH
jgi:hypothetical protein